MQTNSIGVARVLSNSMDNGISAGLKVLVFCLTTYCHIELQFLYWSISSLLRPLGRFSRRNLERYL